MPFDTLLTDEKIEQFTRSGGWKNTVLTDYLDAAADAHPDQTAIVDARGSITYREFREQVDRAALGYLELGIVPGDTISIQLPNWREWLIAHYAAVRIGAVTNPLIPIYRDNEVGYMMQAAQTKLLVTTGDFRGFDYVAMAGRLRSGIPSLEHVLVVRPTAELPDWAQSWDDFAATPWEERRDPAQLAGLRPDPNELVLLIFTSGTTGRPKGVMHTHNTLIAGSMPWPDRLGMDHTAVVHMASTFGHLTGYLYGVSLPTILGGTGVFQDVWNVDEFLALVDEHGIQHTSGATPFLHDLINAPGLAVRDLSSLRRFCCMGAPIPGVFLTEAAERIPGMTVFGGWGQTECCLVTMGHPDDLREKIAATDGKALPGMEVRVLTADGALSPVGEEGRLQVRGPFLFQGYVGDDLQTARDLIDEDGWFDTGDIATMDAEGYIRLQGRTKDVIIRGGENIPVAYVENILYGHPWIDTVAVVALPHPRLQEIACAVVTINPGSPIFTLEDLRAYFAEKGVAKPYWPEQVVVVESLPRTPSGKIQKFQLRAQLEGTVTVTDTVRQVGASA
ncbi:AMP-binding protein [Microbacterium sp. ASV49]|uniref:AMP-binding protein n=1 Tax=Microbacterium candidum TaxID=3041922 RepID=A0ABT7MW59_9MICO|nr:AMP-binding protein [Microbacterium sp. ASV49]MDL9978677.1 AMP-binding protein [Microbacterium sp. ASV49]